MLKVGKERKRSMGSVGIANPWWYSRILGKQLERIYRTGLPPHFE